MRAALARITVLAAFALLCLSLGGSAFAPAQAAPAGEERIALVIGNGAYREAALKNPVNDARDVAALLKTQGFNVTLKLNVGVKEMDEAVRQFGQALRRGGVGLFYFAGHGLQVGGSNYLVPVDAKIQSESDVRFECVDAGRVLGKMEDAGNGLNLVILDACRNNPFARSFRSASLGLAKMDAPTGSLIAYATAPGSVAADGNGRNGLYTQYLLRNIGTPGLSVEELFKRVRMGVAGESAKKQVPWEASSLIGQFSFAGGTQVASLAPAPVPAVALKYQQQQREAAELEARRQAEEQAALEQAKQQQAPVQQAKAERVRLLRDRFGAAQGAAAQGDAVVPSASVQPRGYLGTRVADVQDDVARVYGLRDTRGAVVSEVTAGSPAALCGMLAGDVVLRAGGQPVDKAADLVDRVRITPAGELMALTVWRGGRDQVVVCRIGAPPQAAGAVTGGRGALTR